MCAEIYAVKNDYASVEGGDEVWIRGSKMIGNRKQFDIKLLKILLLIMFLITATVLFEIRDQSTNTVKSYRGMLKKEECHQVSDLLGWFTTHGLVWLIM